MELLISLIAGAVGGNAAGGLFKSLNQGTLINSLSGVVGGGLGGTLLGMLGTPDLAGIAGDAGGLDIGAIIGQVAGGGIGGGVVLAIVGAVRNMMAK
ncbi:hypothetical protein [Thalassovita taeanensis]|uniref:DNA methyltransferase n=1 Tax=Thalassovita taeanensis TaxID=657014 RepID=A0A1H9C891_9RHOB|nr:hypothetical protein [Thalassovita taeanensis]SEP97187.1 hypothetical protein SAMN04488092_103153 [Thalassovita taeanensis]